MAVSRAGPRPCADRARPGARQWPARSGPTYLGLAHGLVMDPGLALAIIVGVVKGTESSRGQSGACAVRRSFSRAGRGPRTWDLPCSRSGRFPRTVQRFPCPFPRTARTCTRIWGGSEILESSLCERILVHAGSVLGQDLGRGQDLVLITDTNVGLGLCLAVLMVLSSRRSWPLPRPGPCSLSGVLPRA